MSFSLQLSDSQPIPRISLPSITALFMILFSSRLLILRSMRQITQSDLAKNIRVTRQTIAAIEMGTKAPTLYTAMKIAKYFETSVESIFTFKESRK